MPRAKDITPDRAPPVELLNWMVLVTVDEDNTNPNNRTALPAARATKVTVPAPFCETEID
jgi:hypothetical protein